MCGRRCLPRDSIKQLLRPHAQDTHFRMQKDLAEFQVCLAQIAVLLSLAGGSVGKGAAGGV